MRKSNYRVSTASIASAIDESTETCSKDLILSFRVGLLNPITHRATFEAKSSLVTRCNAFSEELSTSNERLRSKRSIFFSLSSENRLAASKILLRTVSALQKSSGPSTRTGEEISRWNWNQLM